MPQPLGVVGIIAPWNYPLQLTLAPAIGAIAAGNRVIIKPSELVPRFAALLQETVARRFDAAEVLVTGVEDEIAKGFASLPFDHLVFTGTTRVGRLVAEAAGRNLTPVTLELGGKSPAIIDASADLEEAAERIAYAKLLNAGQTCISALATRRRRSLSSTPATGRSRCTGSARTAARATRRWRAPSPAASASTTACFTSRKSTSRWAASAHPAPASITANGAFAPSAS
ncbi:hypothetical protein ACVIIV_000761 [Bradyrhizobium sp. USDA 4354]